MNCVILPLLLAGEAVASLHGFAEIVGFYETGPAPARAGVTTLAPTRLGDVAPSTFVATNHTATGEVASTTSPPLRFADDQSTPGCNAALDAARGAYVLTDVRTYTYVASSDCAAFGGCGAGSSCCVDPTAPGDSGTCFAVGECASLPAGAGLGAGELLSIDVVTGAIVANVSMYGVPHHPVALAHSAATGLAYGTVPYDYTEYGLFSFNATSGEVAQIDAFAKQSMDGLADCVGGVLSTTGELFWQFAGADGDDALVFYDVTARAETRRVSGFFAPVTEDASRPGTLLALANRYAGAAGVSLVRLDASGGASANVSAAEVFNLASTSLGDDVRAQDQASLAVDAAGARAWFAASYNDASGALCRGVYELALDAGGESATLVSEAELFGQPDKPGVLYVGRLDWL